MTKRRLNQVNFVDLVDELKERRKTRWCPDPHRRGRIIPSKKLYKRKPRMPSGVSHFTGSPILFCHAHF
jgi:hypothetical protein